MYILILLYIGTLIVTFGIRIINNIMLVLDLAHEFLKIDFDMMEKWEDNIQNFNLSKIDYQSFIPFYNVIKSAFNLYDYNCYLENVFNNLDNLEIIKPMANFEKVEYLKNPSIINLFRVLKIGREKLLMAEYFYAFQDNGKEEGRVLYEKNGNDITILDMDGKFKNMMTSEIIDILKTNDSKRIFNNFIHDNGEKVIVVTNKDITKQEDVSSKKKKEIIALQELKKDIEKLNDEKGIQKKIGKRKN